jgi:D-threo-aldose 1-dehydrogenase
VTFTLPALGFGAANVGNLFRPMSNADAHATLEAAWEAGLRYYDTAPFYGFGLSERRIGDALRGCDGLIVSTKVGRLLRPAPDVSTDAVRHGFASSLPFEPVFDYSYDGVMRSHEASLQRLGLASVDILYVHDIGRATHGTEHDRHWRDLFDGGGYRALDELRSSGAVRAIGVGVNETQACIECMEQGQFDLVLLAGRYTLLDQTALAEVLPMAASQGAHVIAAGIYNSGVLATGTRGTPIPMYDYAPASSEILARVHAIESKCDRFNVPLAAAALQFPGRHPAVATTLIGMATAAQVASSIEWSRVPIPLSLWTELTAKVHNQ